MKAALRNNLATLVLLIALLIAVYQGEPWTAGVISGLFVFVLFPRWRRAVYRIVFRITGGHRRHNVCDSNDHGSV